MKYCLKHGCNIVPIFNFGENDLFSTTIINKKSNIGKIQNLIKRLFRYTIPLFYGRSLLTYNFGFLPFRYPLTTVIGKPL